MKEYNPFTGKTRHEAEESGEEVVLETENNVEKIKNPLLEQAEKIAARADMTDYEKKWAKNKDEVLDMVNPAKNIFQQEITREKVVQETTRSFEQSVVEEKEVKKSANVA